MYQQNTSPEKGCYYENKNHSIMFMECKTANCYYKQLKRLQAENERLKEINLQLQTIDMEIDRNNKYRKSLEEIRDITKMFYNSVLNAIATGTNIDRTGAIIKIQEICSEVLG